MAQLYHYLRRAGCRIARRHDVASDGVAVAAKEVSSSALVMWRPAFLFSLLPALVLGAWLYWPTLGLGLYADDYIATATMDGAFAAPRGSLDLFNFADGSRGDVARLRLQGSIPWWAPDDFRVAFLRPLSSALWHLDRALFGQRYWAYHAHSLGAWALLAVVAAAFYRRFFGYGVMAAALVVFALDDSQHFPVMWLSNRGALYAGTAGLLAAHCHLAWRRDGRVLGAMLSAAFASVGLLFGEWVFPFFAYVLAYEMTLDRGTRVRRLLSLAPIAVPGLAFLVVRSALGYGARGSGAYVDPVVDPARFGVVLLGRIPVFAADMLWNVPSDWWDHGSPWRETLLRLNVIPPLLWVKLPGWPVWHVVLGCAALLGAAIAFRWMWRRVAPDERDASQMLLVGALLSMLPVAGGFASTRLTLAAFFGLAPSLVLVVRELLCALAATPLPKPARWAFMYLLAVAILYLQVLAPFERDFRALVADYRAAGDWALSAELDDTRVPRQRVFMLSALEFTSTFFFSYIRHAHGHPLPRSYCPISVAPYALRVTREAADTLRLETLGGGFVLSGVESMFRPLGEPLVAGQGVALPGLRVQVGRVIAGEAKELFLRFELNVDDPRHVFLISRARGLVRFDPPPVGRTAQIKRPLPPNWLAIRRSRYERAMWPLPDFLFFDPIPAFIEFDPRPRAGAQ